MRRFLLLLAALVVAACAGSTAGLGSAGGSDEWARVQWVVDGDTLSLTNGERVRLVQIDTPELGSGECYSRKAAAVLRTLTPAGSVVRLEADWRLDSVDRYGRLLRYVFRRG